MSEEMTFETELKRLLDREPFVPFKLILNSGDRYEVVDPHALAMGGNLIAILHPRQGLSFFRKSQVTGVDAPEPETTSSA